MYENTIWVETKSILMLWGLESCIWSGNPILSEPDPVLESEFGQTDLHCCYFVSVQDWDLTLVGRIWVGLLIFKNAQNIYLHEKNMYLNINEYISFLNILHKIDVRKIILDFFFIIVLKYGLIFIPLVDQVSVFCALVGIGLDCVGFWSDFGLTSNRIFGFGSDISRPSQVSNWDHFRHLL